MTSLIRSRSFVLWIVAITIALGAASYTAFKTRSGDWTWLWQRAPLTSFTPESGAAYVAPTGRPDLSSHQRISPAFVLENGRPLGPPNTQHADIRAQGRGRFSMWHDYVYLSTSDNTDPRTNGRHYEIWFPPISRTASRALYIVTLVMMGLSAIALAWDVRRRRISWSRLPILLAAFTLSGAVRGGTAVSRRASAVRIARGVVIVAWTVAALLLAGAETACVTRSGDSMWLWHVERVGAVTPETGFAYVAHTGRPDVASDVHPEPTALLEDGVQAGLRNAQHAEIREVGRGRYSFWSDYVIFSTTDNTDPRTNGRTYTFAYPPLNRAQARVLYGAAAAALLFAVALTVIAARSTLVGVPSRAVVFARRYGLTALVALSAVGMVVVTVTRAALPGSPLVGQQWTAVLLANVFAALVFRRVHGAVPRWRALAPFVIAMWIGFYFLTVWAPQRPQGCHTTVPYSPWEMYCVAPDSASYYFHYTPNSTRNPLYPWFIQALTSGSSFSPQQYLAVTAVGAPHTDAHDPLMRVVRTQIVLQLLSATLMALGLMRLVGSPLPAAGLLWMYDMQFFTAEELNFILTETLVMTFQFMVVGAFAMFLFEKRRWLLWAAAAACGAAYLTRQAAAYSGLMLMVMSLMALYENWRRWLWPVVVGAAITLTFVMVPSFYALAVTGHLGGQDDIQYQYRIAHAMQYATPADLELMPDAESRAWLAEKIPIRDREHQAVDDKFPGDEYNRMVYYINQNLYVVATPPGAPHYPSSFYMNIATPILKRHALDYARFIGRFWVVAMERPGISRLGIGRYSPWLTYALLFAAIVSLRDRRALAALTGVVCHWVAVAMSCMFAAPIPRMVWASEFLVVIAGLLVVWSLLERLALRRQPGYVV